MIEFLDQMLRQLFVNSVDEIVDPSQVGFDPPDDKWRNYVSGLNVNGTPVDALNVYLVDLRENRTLRSNERVRDLRDGTFSEAPRPRRMDCHYLISAWSSAAAATDQLTPAFDEHELLYNVTAALMNAEPLIPSQIYGPGGLPAGFPDVIADAELPSIVLPVEGFPKLAEFWGATKTVHWKPAVYLIVTLPVVLQPKVAGPMVTTRITDYRTSGGSQVETWIQIGGTVLTATDPVPGAWVRIEDSGGAPIATTTSDENGRFTFVRLRAGDYTLRVRAQGFAEKTRPIHVPSPTGDYDVQPLIPI